MTLKVGDKAPDFQLTSDVGSIKLSDYLGKNVVLYFYPKDDTPGCTVEARDFTAKSSKFSDLNSVVIGISKDNVECHIKFKEKYNLSVLLLADEDAEVCQKYDVWQEKSMFGKKYMGIERTTFLIDALGKIVHIWNKVKVDGHADDVLGVVESL